MDTSATPVPAAPGTSGHANAEATAPPASRGTALWRSLGFQVIVSMALGVAAGLLWPGIAASLGFLGTIFLNLIKTAVAPLVFLTVTRGILAAGDFKRIGKVGLTALIYFEVMSVLALTAGTVLGSLFGVGAGHPAANPAAGHAVAAAPRHISILDFVTGLFPDNFVGAFTGGNLLRVLVIALLFGFGLLALAQEKRQPIERGLDSLSTAFFRFVHVILRLAPLGTFGATAYTVGANGTSVLMSLAYLVLSVWAVVILYIAVVLGTVCTLFRVRLLGILRHIKEEILLTLGTASSESALPRLLQKLPAFGVDRQTSGLVLPTGYAFNLDGTSIFMSIGVVFLANTYRVPLGISQQIGILAIMFLTSKGAATVSGGAFVVFAAAVTSTGVLPVAGLTLIFGVYRFLSIAIATANVVGNSVATVIIAKITGGYRAHPVSDNKV
jgi:aerobic C4-dicarboxylate transport protein